MNIALLQTFFKTGDPEHNVETLVRLTRSATRRGADLCVAPELAICGPMPKDLLLGNELLDLSRKALATLAVELKDSAPLLLGSPMLNPVPIGKPTHNCAVLLNKGEVRIVSRKVLLSSNDVFDEHRYFEPGMASGVFNLHGWRFAVVMAEDTANDPSLLNRAHTSEGDPVAECLTGGADALICLGAMPFSAHNITKQENILANIAARYRIPTAFVNHAGAVDGNVFPGMSSAFDHTGGMVARGAFFEDETVMLDLAREKGQKSLPQQSPMPLLWKALSLGLKRYTHDNAFEKVLIGISGGLDSALVAAIATSALGKENVLGVFMPSPYTTQQSRDDAAALAKNLGIELTTISIAPLMQSFETALAPIFKDLAPDVTEENIQARIRGSLLMAIANKKSALLLCTSNKSELAVGYGTLYGDLTGGIAVLGDVYKTDVFKLAAWYNSLHKSNPIPTSILQKEPSAELRPNQKDSDHLPPYDILDAILESYVEKCLPVKDMELPEVEKATIEKVVGLIENSEFKRSQLAPVIRVSVRGFGFGWRMPITK